VRNHIMLLTVAFIVVVTLTGAASAAATNTTTDAYLSGQEVADSAMADANLGLNQSAGNLVITTAGSATVNDQSSEGGAQAVVDTTSSLATGQAITHGSGNLLSLNDPNGPLTYTFVSLATNGALRAQTYTVTGTGLSYIISHGSSVYIGADMTQDQWNYAIEQLGANAYSIICIANLWASGAPADLLAETFTTGNINAGTIASYAMTRSFALTYPNGSNYVITNAGGLDDDALMYGVFGFNEILFSTSSGTPGETAFINYNTDSNNGDRYGVLALMKINDLTSQFKAATGITVVAGTLSEIQYNLWLLNLLKTNPAALFTVETLRSVSENDIAYLWYDDALGYGHGIDHDYIASLSAASATWNTNVMPVTNYGEMFNAGQAAFTAALNGGLFTIDDLAAGNVAVVLAPYYTNLLNTYSLVGFIDGIVSAGQTALENAGYTGVTGFTINNILQIRNPWTWGSNTGAALTSVFINVNSVSRINYLSAASRNIANLVMTGMQVKSAFNKNTGKYSSTTAGAIINASPSNIASGTVLGGNFAIPAVAGIGYAWAANAPYSYIRTIGRVGCICSTREYDLSTYLQEQYPLGPNERYFLLALTGAGETNRQISGRTTGFGVSPSQGTYYAMQGSNSAYPLILIIWNELTNTGRAMLIQYDDVAITAAMENGRYTSTAYKQEADLFWHLDQVWSNGPDAGVLASVITVVKSITIDQTFLNYLTSAGLDSIEKMLAAGEPVTPVTPGSTVQGTVGNGFAAISGAWNNAFNDLTAVTSTSNNEIAPGLSLGQSSSSAAAGTSTTSASSTVAGIPVGAILGGLFLILAGILLYLGRNTIVAVIKGYGRPGK
jgi:formylmethanofuran dehydrogenase subunit E-like metal-binding protein